MNKMNYSEVFDNFVKIASDKGLISTAEEASYNPSVGSDDLDTIELMYGVKNSKDKKDIIDTAHPDRVIIAPSYDKVNGLVENTKERQNIMVDLVSKMPTGNLTNHKYADKELLAELVRLGFVLDSAGHDDLRVLADSASEKLVKQSFDWGAAAGAVGLGLAAFFGSTTIAVIAVPLLAVGLVTHWQHHIDQGVMGNCSNTIIQLQELLDEEEYSQIHPQIQTIIKNLEYVKNLGIAAMNAPVPTVEEGKEELAKDSAEVKQFDKIFKKYTNGIRVMSTHIPTYIKLLEGAQTQDGEQEYEWKWWTGVKSVLNKVWQSNISDVIQSLETLKDSLAKSGAAISKYAEAVKAAATEKSAIQDIEEANKGLDDDEQSGASAKPSLPAAQKPKPTQKPQGSINIPSIGESDVGTLNFTN